MSIKTIHLTEVELQALLDLVNEVKSTSTPTENNVLSIAPLLAQELPRTLRSALRAFSENETSDALIIRTGKALPNENLPTPQDYEELNLEYKFNDFQLCHSILSSAIATPIGFRSQREGRCLNNIIPTKTLETLANSSSGSRFDLGLHTEDAFHPYKGDFLGLTCIRNDEKAVTSFASIKSLKLTKEDTGELMQPNFLIGHNPIHKLPATVKCKAQSILYGRYDAPCMRINTANTRALNARAQRALDRFTSALIAERESVVLQQGDFFYLDNFYTAHARDAYTPHYGPRARWLSRLILAKDLRKSVSARNSQGSRIIETDYEVTFDLV